jgi:hypothetical protein
MDQVPQGNTPQEIPEPIERGKEGRMDEYITAVAIRNKQV